MPKWQTYLKRKWMSEGTVHCHWCKKRLNLEPGKNGNFITVDHLKEKALGGTDDEANLVPACGLCNSSRSCKVQGEVPRRLDRMNDHDYPTTGAVALVNGRFRK